MAQSGYAKPTTAKHRPRKASSTDFRPNVPWECATEDERRDFAVFYINQATESGDAALLQTRLHYYLRHPDPDYFLLARMLVNFEEYLPPKEHFALIVAILTAQAKRDSRYMAALLLVLRLIAINGYGVYGWQAGKEVKIVDLALCPPNPQLPLDFLSGEWAQTCRRGVEALQAAWCDLPPTMRQELG